MVTVLNIVMSLGGVVTCVHVTKINNIVGWWDVTCNHSLLSEQFVTLLNSSALIDWSIYWLIDWFIDWLILIGLMSPFSCLLLSIAIHADNSIPLSSSYKVWWCLSAVLAYSLDNVSHRQPRRQLSMFVAETRINMQEKYTTATEAKVRF